MNIEIPSEFVPIERQSLEELLQVCEDYTRLAYNVIIYQTVRQNRRFAALSADGSAFVCPNFLKEHLASK